MDDILTNFLRLTSYISDRFLKFIEDLVVRDAVRYTENFGATPLVNSSAHNSKGYCTRNNSLQPSQVGSENHEIYGRRAINNNSELLVDNRSITVNASYVSAAVPSFLLKGLILPFLGLQYAWSLGIASCKYSFPYIRCAQLQVHRITSRVLKTLRGSSDDIGWLQHAPGMPLVHDGTSRFLELLSDIRNGKDSLPSSFVYLLIPGLFSNHGPLYFVATKRFFSKMGLACHIAKVHSEGDIRALEDLTYEKRKEFIMKHKLPLDIPLISFRSEASIAPSVLATMTQIAHAELPRLILPKFGSKMSDQFVESGCQIPVMVPVSAAMAAFALHLQLRYGEKSDGLVTCRDAEVPGSVVVRPNMKLDHTWMVYSSNSKKKYSSEPDAREMCQALFTLLVELGKTEREVEQVL